MSPPRGGTLVLAALVALLGIAYWQLRLVAPVRLPQDVSGWNSDLYTIYLPTETFAYQSPRFLPTWNPEQLAGTPFLANYNGGVLYPPNFVAALLPVGRAIGYVSALHVGLAGVLTFTCARALALSAPAATLGAVGFMLNDYFLFERFRPSFLAGLAWLPALFLAAGYAVARPSVRRGVLLGAVLAVQLFTGHAQIVCYGANTLAVLAPLALVARRPWEGGYLRRLAVAGVAAVATAVLLAAAQLLPTLELMAHAVRGFGGLTLAQTLSPTPSWALLRQVAFTSGPIVALAVLALGQRHPLLTPLAVVLVGFALLAGIGTPLYTRFFYFLPGVRFFRTPVAILQPGFLGLALLASAGLDALATGGPVAGGRRLASVVGAVVLVAVGWRTGSVGGTAALVVAAATLVPIVRGRRARALACWLVVVLLVAERWGRPGNALMMPQNNDAAFFAPPAFVDFLRARTDAGRVLAIKDWQRRFPIMEKVGSLYGFPVAQDYEPLAPAAYHEFLRPLEDVNVDAPLFWGRLAPAPLHRGWTLLDLLAVRWVLVAPGADWPGERSPRFTLVYGDHDARIYENREARPRAFLAASTRVIPDPQAALETVHARRSEEKYDVIVDREPAWNGPTGEPAPREVVAVTSSSPNAVALRVGSPRRAVLVLADLYWPGWRVAVDGRERPLLRVDYLFRGVAIEPGAHRVRFWYDPWMVKLGAAITAVTSIGLLAAGGLALRARAAAAR